MGMENPPFTSMVFPFFLKKSTSQGFLTSTIQINPATSAHEQLQAAGVLLHLSTHSVGQRQDLMSRSAQTKQKLECRLERPLNRLDTEVVPLRYKCFIFKSVITCIAIDIYCTINRYRGFPETSPCHWGMPRFKFGRFPHPITSAFTGKLI